MSEQEKTTLDPALEAVKAAAEASGTETTSAILHAFAAGVLSERGKKEEPS